MVYGGGGVWGWFAHCTHLCDCTLHELFDTHTHHTHHTHRTQSHKHIHTPSCVFLCESHTSALHELANTHSCAPPFITQSILLDQADAQVVKEGEEVTLMDWGNCFLKVCACVCVCCVCVCLYCMCVYVLLKGVRGGSVHVCMYCTCVCCTCVCCTCMYCTCVDVHL